MQPTNKGKFVSASVNRSKKVPVYEIRYGFYVKAGTFDPFNAIHISFKRNQRDKFWFALFHPILSLLGLRISISRRELDALLGGLDTLIEVNYDLKKSKDKIEGIEESAKNEIERLKKEMEEVRKAAKRQVEQIELKTKNRIEEVELAARKKIEEVELLTKKRIESIDSAATQRVEALKQQVESEKTKARQEAVNKFVEEGLLQSNEEGSHKRDYDRLIFDEMTSRLNEIEKERDAVKRQQQIVEMQQLLNESKQQVNEVKTQREWQKAEQTQHTAEMSGLKVDMEGKLKDEELKREREELKREKQDFKIESTAVQFDLQRQQMMVDFGKMQNDLAEVGLGLKDFVLQKAYEFKTYELSVKEHILKMGEMINWVDAKSLETERAKMEVMERLAQMGLALKEHETYLEKTLLSADRLKLEADRQNVLNEQQANEVAMAMEKFNVEYGGKHNELERFMLQVEEGRFNNQAKASMMEMDSKVLEVQTQLKGLAYERVGMDMMFREGQMRVSEKESQISMMKLQIEQKVNELKHLRELGRLENQVESEKMKSIQRENRLQGQIGHLQNEVDKEGMRSEYLRQTMRFLHHSGGY